MAFLNLDEYKNNVARAQDYMWSWLRQAREDFEFAALKQWKEEDREALEQQLRPALVFDVTRPLIKAVTGAEMTGRYKAKFTGFNLELEEKDREAAEVFDIFYNWVRLHGKSEHHESLAFQDLAICGIGAIDIYLDYSRYKDGQILYRRAPVFDVAFDPSAIEPNVEDRWFCYRDRFVPETTFERLYPDAQDILNAVRRQDGAKMEGTVEKIRRKMGKAYSRKDDRSQESGNDILMTGYDRTSKSVRIRDYQWKELKYKSRIIGRDQNGVSLSDEFYTTSEASNFMSSIDPESTDIYYEEQKNHPVIEYFRAHVANNVVLNEQATGLRDFTLQFLTGEEDWTQYLGDKGSGYKFYFGLMRSMKDPQSYRNKFFSQAVHIFNSNPKGLLIYETDMFENVSQAMSAWNKAEGAIGVEPGKLANQHGPKFQHINQQFSFAGTDPLFQNATAATYEAAGINPSVTGGQAQDLRRVSTSSLSEIKASNLASLSNYFDALRLYRKNAAELTIELARKHFSREIIARIVGIKYAANVNLLFDMDVQDYDVVVEESDADNTPSEDMFTAVMQNAPNLISMGFPIVPGLFKYAAAFLPTDVAKEWEELIRNYNSQQQTGGPGGTPLPPPGATDGGMVQ